MISKKQIFFAGLATPFIFNSLVMANTSPSNNSQQTNKDTEKTASSNDEEMSKLEEVAKSAWSRIGKELDRAKIRLKYNTPTLGLANGFDLSAGAKVQSVPSIAGKYSGVDVWEIKANIYPQLFGLKDLPFSASAEASRQVTYIQQFNTRKESLIRLPYDPITKIPFKSEDFFKKEFNKATQKEEYKIKVGDFIGFRAPLTLSVGKDFFTKEALKYLKLTGAYTFILNNEFDVHVFRMSENLVRIKILAIYDKGHNLKVGTSVFGLDGTNELIAKAIIDDEIFKIQTGRVESTLQIADFVFNLNSQESRNMYDKLVGHRMKIFDAKAFSEQLKHTLPYTNKNERFADIIADLEAVNDMNNADRTKNLSDKRVIKILSAKNRNRSKYRGLSIDVLDIVKLEGGRTRSDSKIAIKLDDNHVQNYQLTSIKKNFEYEWFWLWGTKKQFTNSILLKIDKNDHTSELAGTQMNYTLESNSIKAKDFLALKKEIEETYPQEILNQLKFPNWDFKNGGVKNLYFQQDIFISKDIFKFGINVSKQQIKDEIMTILKNQVRIKAQPTNNGGYQLGADRNGAPRSFQVADYGIAFDYDATIIANTLGDILNGTEDAGLKYQKLKNMMAEIPLYNEISSLLLMRLIPKDQLKDVVIARLAFSGSKVDSMISQYPSLTEYNKTVLVRDIMSQNDFILDRSYNLRTYIKEDGSIYTLEEILPKSELK
ncbi:MAG: hypothetical protein ACK41T_00005 [Pseudobdellovibrio sp.]